MADEVVDTPVADPEPEGIIEIPASEGKQKVVPVAVLTAERDRIRKAEGEKHAKELEPLKAKAAVADQLAADLQALQPQLEHLKRHPELLKADEPPAVQAVSDDEAESFAREYELYTATGLNVPKAKQLIAKQRAEVARVARDAAAEAIKPLAASTALDRSKANFTAAYYAKDTTGRPLVDPQILAEQWRLVPAELSQNPEVAQLILDRAIGIAHRMGKQQPAAQEPEPIFSEAPGGRGTSYQMSDMERKVAAASGVGDKDWTKAAATYKPGQMNVIGD